MRDGRWSANLLLVGELNLLVAWRSAVRKSAAALRAAIFYDPFVNRHFVRYFKFYQFRDRATAGTLRRIPDGVKRLVIVQQRTVIGIALVVYRAFFFTVAGNANVFAAARVNRFRDIFPFTHGVANFLAMGLATAVIAPAIAAIARRTLFALLIGEFVGQ